MAIIHDIRILWNEVPTDFESVIVILRHEQNCVLVRNKNRAWEFPGGHREKNETALETARREVWEEAGVAGQDYALHGYYTLPNGHKTVIASAVTTVKPSADKLFYETIDVTISPSLPSDLSFPDGLYEKMLGHLFPEVTYV